MPSDDEILAHVRLRATSLRRRQRLLWTSAAALVVAALVGSAAIAATVPDPHQKVSTADDPRPPDARREPEATTTVTASPEPPAPPSSSLPSPSTAPPATGPVPSTAPPASSPPTTAPPAVGPPPSTTSPRPGNLVETITASGSQDGLTVDVRAFPSPDGRHVYAEVRLRTTHGSRLGGQVMWEPEEGVDSQHFGSQEPYPGTCAPETDGPDAQATATSASFDLSYEFRSEPGPHVAEFIVWSSLCHDESVVFRVSLDIAGPS